MLKQKVMVWINKLKTPSQQLSERNDFNEQQEGLKGRAGSSADKRKRAWLVRGGTRGTRRRGLIGGVLATQLAGIPFRSASTHLFIGITHGEGWKGGERKQEKSNYHNLQRLNWTTFCDFLIKCCDNSFKLWIWVLSWDCYSNNNVN